MLWAAYPDDDNPAISATRMAYPGGTLAPFASSELLLSYESSKAQTCVYPWNEALFPPVLASAPSTLCYCQLECMYGD